MTTYVLTVNCHSTRGIVAAIANYLADSGCNLTDSNQYDDLLTGQFFMRVTFVSQTGATLDSLKAGFEPVAQEFDMEWAIHDAEKKVKVLLMVSNFGHCLNDLLYRWRIGALPVEIVGVVSNHMTYQKVVVNHDIPFHHIKVTKENKPEGEGDLLDVVEESGGELVVLAGYMIQSDKICQKMSGKIIKIHHSFLARFKGGNPYKQVYERGVKLIGVTSHYVITALARRTDHRAGNRPHHPCAKPRGLRQPRPRCRGAGARPGDPRPCAAPRLHQR
uniref:PurU-like protein n=1 Tax=Rhodobacter capsulatus TaxID=1061 RepID=O06440_RHOCA|nr:PurU-like protein [Rhodobacter capsulatus]